jgi:hypothetical protein
MGSLNVANCTGGIAAPCILQMNVTGASQNERTPPRQFKVQESWAVLGDRGFPRDRAFPQGRDLAQERDSPQGCDLAQDRDLPQDRDLAQDRDLVPDHEIRPARDAHRRRHGPDQYNRQS